MIRLYNPKTNVISESTYDYLADLTGKGKNNLQSHRSKGKIIGNIGMYILKDDTTLQKRREWYAKISYNDEAWIPIKGSGGIYKVSNYGRIKRIYNTKEKFVLPYQRKGKGNLFVKAVWDGKRGEYNVGRLVAAHFIREPKPGDQVVRKNGIVTDDYVGNLKYVTKQELGKISGYKSRSKGVIQLDENTMEIINEYGSAREAGRNSFYSYQAILDRCNGDCKQSDGQIWMFSADFEDTILKKVE